MSKTYFKIDSVLKFVEEDSYEEGCLPNTAQSHLIDVEFKGENPESVIQQFCDFLGVKNTPESVDKNACDENGRVDIALMENSEGYEATPSQVENWKEGNFKLFYSVYSGVVTKITEEEVTL